MQNCLKHNVSISTTRVFSSGKLAKRYYARFNFHADSKETIKLLEDSSNSGWCWDGEMNITVGFEGLIYADMLHLIIEASHERFNTCRIGTTDPGKVKGMVELVTH